MSVDAKKVDRRSRKKEMSIIYSTDLIQWTLADNKSENESTCSCWNL